MTRAVVDASAALSWLLTSQATTVSQQFEETLDGFELEAPFVFEWEVHNILLGLVRGGKLDDAGYEALLYKLATSEVRIAPPIDVVDVMVLARIEGLSLFDAAYLSHAVEHGMALIAKDRALLAAAGRHGLVVFDLN